MNQRKLMTRSVSARSGRGSSRGMGGVRTEICRGRSTYLAYQAFFFEMALKICERSTKKPRNTINISDL